MAAATPAGAARLDGVHARVAAAVARVAATDPNPADPFRGLYITDEAALRLAADAGAEARAADDRVERAARALGLDDVAATVLAACAMPELDARYGRLYAYLHDDVTRRLPTARLLAALLADAGRPGPAVLAALGRDAPLRRRGAVLVLGDDDVPLADRPLKVAEPLAAFLLGAPLDRASTRVRRLDAPPVAAGRDDVAAGLRRVLALEAALPVLVHGADAEALVAAATATGLVAVAARDVDDPPALAEGRLVAALEGRTLVVDRLDEVEPVGARALRDLLERERAGADHVLLVAPDRGAAAALADTTVLSIDVPAADHAERAAAWAGLTGAADTDAVAAKFALSLAQIAEGAAAARLAAGRVGRTVPRPDELDLGARHASSSRLGELAARVDAAHTWEQLVLPARQHELLRAIAGFLRHRDLVFGAWGFERAIGPPRGLKVLFAGESGTGKTMASQVLARHLGLELFRVDLATVVSKYIGETEKNLSRIFAAARGSNAILLFDEADALFGKRSEVADAHDRYANVETAYLLQEMEAYAGIAILTTNFRRNIDDAFTRRLDFVVDFPFPEPSDRRRLWTRLLGDDAPREDDVDLDFLAEQFKLSGGAIRNCALMAAFGAAAEGSAIGMRHLVRAVAQEFGKQGRLTLEADFGPHHDLLAPGPVGTGVRAG